ncbi:hypothetical protein ACFL6U_18710 [Planctomycetota bacterium]
MLFHITQSHTPELCPKDQGGSKTLFDPQVEGVVLKAMYGAFAEHVIYYIVEAESMKVVNQFLMPGFKRCNCQITPVSEEPIVQ